MQSATPKVLLLSVWPLSLSLAATKEIDVSFSSSAYLDVSVQRVSPRYAMYLHNADCVLTQPGFPIRISADQWIFAPPRSFSQLVTSFFGATYQGILRKPFVAWSSLLLLVFTQKILFLFTRLIRFLQHRALKLLLTFFALLTKLALLFLSMKIFCLFVLVFIFFLK